jgi:hypothetical protein
VNPVFVSHPQFEQNQKVHPETIGNLSLLDDSPVRSNPKIPANQNPNSRCSAKGGLTDFGLLIHAHLIEPQLGRVRANEHVAMQENHPTTQGSYPKKRTSSVADPVEVHSMVSHAPSIGSIPGIRFPSLRPEPKKHGSRYLRRPQVGG